MDKYVCTICGYVYDPEQGDPDNGIDPGTKFEDLPDDYECPVCGAAPGARQPAGGLPQPLPLVWPLYFFTLV